MLSIVAQLKYSKMDLSKCICEEPGFCPIFGRTMGENPPDWKWCKKTNALERKKYFDLVSKCKSQNRNIFDIIKSAKNKYEAMLYYLTLVPFAYNCDISNQNQIKKNQRIIELIQQCDTECDFTNIEIACLGHSEEQFKNIEEKSYIRKVNLNDLEIEKYGGNEWAESRAFLAKNLFSRDVDFVGYVTASWNSKYKSFSRIDNFHNWYTAKILLNSKPEDNIVLCADIFCPCWWTTNQNHHNNILSSFFSADSSLIGNTLLKLVKLDNFNHIKVPFANQIISHKYTIQKYTDYLKEQNILDKVDWFVKKYTLKYVDNSNEIKALYQNNRIQAYLMEMIFCFWSANQDFVYIPNAEKRIEWYNSEHIKRRIEKWNMIS